MVELVDGRVSERRNEMESRQVDGKVGRRKDRRVNGQAGEETYELPCRSSFLFALECTHMRHLCLSVKLYGSCGRADTSTSATCTCSWIRKAAV